MLTFVVEWAINLYGEAIDIHSSQETDYQTMSMGEDNEVHRFSYSVKKSAQ
jgi:hypothetical protein